jgi:hypothetical protein
VTDRMLQILRTRPVAPKPAEDADGTGTSA